MKISVVTSPFCELPPDAIGAIERRWSNTADEFAKNGNTVQLLGKRGRTLLPDAHGIVRTYIKGYGRTGSVYGDIFLDFFYTFRALKKLKGCDILVVNTFWGPIIAPLFFRNSYRRIVYNVARFPKRHLRLYTKVNLFACTSGIVKHELCRVAPNLSSAKIVVVNNPIDTSVFNSTVPLTEMPCPIIGYHGRIHREKGLHILASAVAECAKTIPGLRLKLIGPWETDKGGDGESYKAELDNLSGNRIDWIGAVSNRMCLASELRKCSAYCYPSIAEKGETFGVSPLEAMGLGLPVIVSNLECFNDFLENEVSGLTFNHRSGNSKGELTSKILMLLQDKKLRAKLGRNAADKAKGFSTAAIANVYESIFRNLLNEDICNGAGPDKC